jgi:hypothetical protein
MRIATWNLQSDKPLTQEREALFRQAMNTVDADVWVLTETWVNFAPGEGYRLAAESSLGDDLKTWPDRRWVAIWVKSPHVGIQQVSGQPDRMACCRIEMSNQQNIVVAGTVLPWSSDELWPGDNGFCASLALQTVDWGTLRGGLNSCTLVVAGDFNQSIPHERWYGFKKGEEALIGAFQELDLMCLTQGKCPLTSKPRIDHICISRSSLDLHSLPKVGDWAIPSVNDKPATDHSGVYVDLETKSLP